MNKIFGLIGLGVLALVGYFDYWVLGLGVLALVGYFDYWVWSNLIHSGLEQIGALVGFGILALVSFPVTIFSVIVGLIIMGAD